MCSSTNTLYRHNQYELLSLIEFFFFITLKKTSKDRKPKIIRFVNHNKYKHIENWLKKQLLLYSPF
jgi:hypothetical protein